MIRKKLWSILNHLNLEYKASGTRLSNFFDFCGIQDRFSDISGCWSARQSLYGKQWELYLTISSSTKRRRENDSELREAIHELWTSHLEVELSKQKMYLMQHQEENWAAEKIFRQKEWSAYGDRAPIQATGESTLQNISSNNKKKHVKLQSISSSSRKKFAMQENMSSINGSASRLVLENWAEIWEMKPMN